MLQNIFQNFRVLPARQNNKYIRRVRRLKEEEERTIDLSFPSMNVGKSERTMHGMSEREREKESERCMEEHQFSIG